MLEIVLQPLKLQPKCSALFWKDLFKDFLFSPSSKSVPLQTGRTPFVYLNVVLPSFTQGFRHFLHERFDD